MTGPFLTLKESAKYCGYKYDTFKKIAREYSLPRYGPNRSKLSQVDLDSFMVDPTRFVSMSRLASNKRHKPIKIKYE